MTTDTLENLGRILLRLDGKGYKAYKEIRGAYRQDALTVFIDHVQGDPFAVPSKIRIRLDAEQADVPPDLFRNPIRRIALEDFLARRVAAAIVKTDAPRAGSGKSGLVLVDAGGQEVLERTAIVVEDGWVEARLYVGLPADGRRILGREAWMLLCQTLPEIADAGLRWANQPEGAGEHFVDCVENQEFIRSRLDELGLVAFLAEGSLLPRASGVSDLPMEADGAVPLSVPDAFRVSLELPNPVREGTPEKRITGMGVPKGVTLIVGGGYHGKSTVLQALERGVYPHVPGDGREYVATARDAVKIRAEDRRRVENVDISGFITNLPFGRDTLSFCSDDASGSTSQAANIVEALEMGATLLLLDEDTSATNFMVRDARMQALVQRESEPITPFLERVRELYETLGVSTVLVMGGCGDYFDAADQVIMMGEYQPLDRTAESRRVAADLPTLRKTERAGKFPTAHSRIPRANSFDASRGKRDVKIDVRDLWTILFGRELIDLRALEQLVDHSQTRAIGYGILLATRFMEGGCTLRGAVEKVGALFDEEGLDVLDPHYQPGGHPGDFARPRRYELAAAINRLRSARLDQA